MAVKNIVVFSDGTGNSSGKLFRTNVWRTYQALDLRDPQHLQYPRQFAFYDNGVGTSSFKPYAILGGAIGLGLARNVRDIYAFICRTWQPGDKIYAFGFSRGAFTVRVLLGLMTDQGLVPYDGDEEQLQRNVRRAYRAYRRNNFKQRFGLARPLRWIRDAAIDTWDAVRGKDRYDPTKNRARKNDLQIEFVGLWDTVDAYGLPVDELTRAVDYAFWPLSIQVKRLSSRVKLARHALALDDERNTFHPKLWTESPADTAPTVQVETPYPGAANATAAMRPRINQVWFAGVHSNVGGGYPDDSLSYIALLWILEGAREAGLRFVDSIVATYAGLSDENGPIYDSRAGLGSYYRYNPRRIQKIIDKEKVTLQSVKIHESVFRRIAVGEDGYAPIVLPPKFEVVKIDGAVVNGDQYLKLVPAPHGGKVHILSGETEQVWNHVWKRRVAYFTTLFASLALAFTPIYLETASAGACRSDWCFISPIVRAVGAFLPGFAGTWVDVLTTNPGWFLILGGIIAAGLAAGAHFSTTVSDAMRTAWYSVPQMRPSGLPEKTVQAPSALDRLIQTVRMSSVYQDALSALTLRILPAIFVILVALYGLLAASKVWMTVDESRGMACRSDAPPSTDFDPRAFCTRLAAEVTTGGRYLVSVKVTERFNDGGSIPAGPNGIVPEFAPWYLPLAVPVRRHLTRQWFKLMLRIGPEGSDVHAPDWRREPADVTTKTSGLFTYTTELAATSQGPLYAYVNDAAIYPARVWPFYGNNRGRAEITVKTLSEVR